ncbi:MAG: two-component sensor histidine kinase, partial [Acetobacteraceae bacterium]|nr:two-component sensor histidine kinase [Acetobacteraceae bacterium]
GLGLAIARHIVIRHRGRLSIESTEGVGTKVSVWLPTG